MTKTISRPVTVRRPSAVKSAIVCAAACTSAWLAGQIVFGSGSFLY